MNSHSILHDSFFGTPHYFIAFEKQELPSIINNNSFIELIDDNLCTAADNPDADTSTLLKDVNRGCACNNQDYRKAHSELKGGEFNEEKLNNFIKESLKIDNKQFKQLKKFYTQLPSHFLKDPIVGCLQNSSLPFFLELKKYESNLFSDQGKIYLELKATNPTLFDVTKFSEAGIIPGTIAYQFVLTDDGFKLEKFAATNQLLFDLSIKNKMDDFEERLTALNRENNFTGFLKNHWPSFAIGLGLALTIVGVIALGVFTFGLAPALITIGGAITAGMLSGTPALLAGSAALVVGAVASYAVLLSGAIGLTALWEKFSNKGTIPPAEPVSDSSSESYSTTSDEESVLNSGNLIKAFNAQSEPTSQREMDKQDFIIPEDRDDNTLLDRPSGLNGDQAVIQQKDELNDTNLRHNTISFGKNR